MRSGIHSQIVVIRFRAVRVLVCTLLLGLISVVAAQSTIPATGPATLPAATVPATLPAPPLITLEFTNASSAEILAALQRQVDKDVALSFTRDGVRDVHPITLSVKEKPFWQAVMEFCKAADLTVYQEEYNGDTRPGVLFGRVRRWPGHTSGALRSRPTAV